MLPYAFGSHFTASLWGVHPCRCHFPHRRHEDHKSCRDDATNKLPQPSSYAHIITTTPPPPPYLCPPHPTPHYSIVEVTSA